MREVLSVSVEKNLYFVYSVIWHARFSHVSDICDFHNGSHAVKSNMLTV